MDCHVRYYDCATHQVTTRFITSSFLGHAKASDLKEAFQDNCKRLDPQKLLQVSMDGPNVNLKFHRDLSSQLVADYNKKRVDLGTCGLHQVHNAFKHAMQASSFEIDLLLYVLWTLFHNTPARREDFKRLTGGDKFPLKFWRKQMPWLWKLKIKMICCFLPSLMQFDVQLVKS